MDDDGLTRERVAEIREHWRKVGAGYGNPELWFGEMVRICDLALSALESRSEVLEEAIRLLRRVVGPSFLDNSLQGQIEKFLASRAEPGAPINLPFERLPQHASDPGFGPVPSESKIRHLHDEPNAAGQAGQNKFRTAPSHEGHAAGPASAAPELAQVALARQAGIEIIKTAPEVAAPQMPDPTTGSAPSVTAAAHDVPEVYSRDYAQGRARGFAEGLEEAAKVCESIIYGMHKPHDRSGFLIACDEAFADGHRLATGRCAAAIRAKIKPARGET